MAAERAETILIADGDAAARSRINESLSFNGMHCDEAATARDALCAAKVQRPSMLTLDVVLPDLSGFGLCRMIREDPQLADLPIMFVSEKCSEIERVLALEAGADDFVAIPFHPAELVARVVSILRRTERRRPESASACHRPAVSIDASRWRGVVMGRAVDLTPSQLALLEVLVSMGGRVVSRTDLLDRLGRLDGLRSERAIDAHVKNLRRRLGSASSLIETVRGVGYRYAEPASWVTDEER
jgi:DNA-binding response OmpR family regulator